MSTHQHTHRHTRPGTQKPRKQAQCERFRGSPAVGSSQRTRLSGVVWMQACEQSRHRLQPFGTCASQRPSTARRNLSVRPRGYHVRWRGRRERKPTTTPARDRSFGGTLAALWADDGPLEAPAVWWWCHKAVRGESDACVGTRAWCRGVDELRRTHCQNVGRTDSTREACEYQLFTRYEQSTAQTSHAHTQPHTHTVAYLAG